MPSPTNVETIQANFGSQIEIPCGLMTYNNDRLQWRRLDKVIYKLKNTALKKSFK